MFKLSSFFLSICFVVFMAWIFMSTDVHERLDRACKPVDWTGNVVLSMAAFVAPKSQTSVDAFFKKTDYACQYTIWRLIYEDEWKAQQQTENQY
jgi:hypothetical protein